jgi:hypothetical protein
MWLFAQGEAMDSALEGEDDETKIDHIVAVVTGDLQLVVAGQALARNSSSTPSYLLIL